MKRRLRNVAASMSLPMLLAGCGFGDLNSHVLPGTAGTGEGSYTVYVELETAANLVPNSEVKLNDLTVGGVRSIRLDSHTFHAVVTLGLDEDVRLPQGTLAAIGQKSLLGAQYVELDAGPVETSNRPLLGDGDTIPLEHARAYPSTEDVLGGLSLVLNGGGLANVQTIVRETNAALSGRVGDVRHLVSNLDVLLGSLDQQRSEIVAALHAMDGFAGRLRAQTGRLGTAIDELGPGMAEIRSQQANLLDGLDALDRLSAVAQDVVDTSGATLRHDLRALQPTLNGLAAAGDSLPESLDLLGTFLLPIRAIHHVVKGDYLNSAATLDLSMPALARGFFPDSPLEEAITRFQTAFGVGNPLLGPLTEPTDPASATNPGGGDIGATDEPPAGTGAPTQAPVPAESTGPSGEDGSLLAALLGLRGDD